MQFDTYRRSKSLFTLRDVNTVVMCHPIVHVFTHNYNTNKDNYQFHMFQLNTVLNTGPKIWNNLPKHVKCSKTLGQFKKKIVSLLNS